jgi:hypothetical protein
LLQVYKDSKKSLNNVNQLDRIQRRVKEQAIKERASSPESVIRRQIKSARRPQTATRNDSMALLSSRADRIDQLFTIESHSKRTSRATTPNRTAATSRIKKPRLVSSKSVIRSIERF